MPPYLQAVLRLPASAAEGGPLPGRGYRILVGSIIVLGLAATLYLALNGELYRPLRQSIEAGNWSEAILKPSFIWASMGLLMHSLLLTST